MEEKDYRLVLVGNRHVGLIGVKAIFEELKPQRGKPESLLKEMLVESAGKKNYIHDSTRTKYEETLLHEFKRFVGEKVEEERVKFPQASVPDPGCHSCNKFEQTGYEGVLLM